MRNREALYTTACAGANAGSGSEKLDLHRVTFDVQITYVHNCRC